MQELLTHGHPYHDALESLESAVTAVFAHCVPQHLVIMPTLVILDDLLHFLIIISAVTDILQTDSSILIEYGPWTQWEL